MIHISKPRIENKGETTFLLSEVYDEVRNIRKDVWFSVDIAYAKYLCHELADSFLLALLPIAVKYSQDISVNAPVSPKLLYNIRTGVEPMYQRIFCKNGVVNIHVSKTERFRFDGTGVVTGCSLGVDSLSSIYHHLEKDMVDEFKLTHLALFNSGQLGDYDLDASEMNFFNTVQEIKPFAESLHLPILAINSNLNSLYKDSGIIVLQTVALRTIAFALSVQKLIRYYVFGSTYPVDKIQFDTFDTEHQEGVLLPLLSTENFHPILADPLSTRVEKTAYIIKKQLVPSYLKVCWAEQTAFEVWHNTTYLEGKTKVNCGWCDKCLRTLLTIEILNGGGDLGEYKEQFDLEKYYEHRNAFIAKVFKQRTKNIYYNEIVDLILRTNYPIPSGILRRYNCQVRKERINQRIKSLIVRIVKKFSWHK